MAFNPFNIFRRNQRAIFAVVTVFVMFTFVLSSGLGGGADFFDWLPGWIGSNKNRGDLLCTIDGTKVYSRDLTDSNTGLRRQRQIANQYMSAAIDMSMQNLVRDMSGKLGRLSREKQQEISKVRDEVLRAQSPREMGRLQDDLTKRLQDKSTKADELDVLQDLRAFNELNLRRSASQTQAGMYFTNVPNRTERDAIEFKLWEKMADKLGIHYTESDVKLLRDRECLNMLGTSEPNVRKMVIQEGRSVTDSRIWSALAAEFRVRTAQNSILGPDFERLNSTLSARAIYTSPYDLYEFYKEKCSPTMYEVLSIPVANYIDRVKEVPNDRELKELYDKYKLDEPNPASDRPGFKEPRKARFEWIEATGTEPYYKAAARDWLKQSEVQATLGQMLLVAPTLPSVAVGSKLLTEPNVALSQEYKEIARGFESDMGQQYSGWAFNFQIQDTSVVKAGNLAAAAGGAAGSILTFASPLTPALLMSQAAQVYERRDRARAGLPLILGAVPGPGFFGTSLAGAAAFYASQPKPLPLGVFTNELRTKQIDSLARAFMAGTSSPAAPGETSFKGDLRAFQAKVEELIKDKKEPSKRKEAAAAYIDEFAKSRGLQKGASTEPRDEFTIDEDPGMVTLKQAMGLGFHGNMNVRFGRKFFWIDPLEGMPFGSLAGRSDREINELRRQFGLQIKPVTGTFQPQFYPSEKGPEAARHEPTFLVWRTEEQPAKELVFERAKPKVIAAWKRIKARELAKQEAERIAQEIQAKKATNDIQVRQNIVDLQDKLRARIADWKERGRIRHFQINDVAEMAIARPSQMSPMPRIQPFQLAKSADIPYPAPEMQKELLDERSKPIDTAFVMTDAPKDAYYVAVVARRDELSPDMFMHDVYAALVNSPIRNDVMGAKYIDGLKKAHEEAVSLLKAEFKYENENAKALDKEARGDFSED